MSYKLSPVKKDEFILSWNNRGEFFRLPVNPLDHVTLTEAHNNQNFETLEDGTFKAIGRRGLVSLQIESFFPAEHNSYCVVGKDELKEPLEYVEMIKKWKRTNRPIRVIQTGVFNLAMSIERFEYYKEKGVNHISYILELEEYRFSNVPASDNPAPVVAETGLRERPNEKNANANVITVTIQSSNDTLWHLAQKHLGDGTKWKEIAKANNISDPRKLKKGQKIKIPLNKGGAKS